MAIVDRRDLPLAVHVACASPHEVWLVDSTLEHRFIAPYPPRLIWDRAYDSDRLDAALWTSFGKGSRAGKVKAVATTVFVSNDHICNERFVADLADIDEFC